MGYKDTLMKVARKLQPDGRAFRMPFGGPMEKFYKAIMSDNIGGIGKAYTDMKQIMSDILPDNPNFTIEDAHDWYRRLGLYDSGHVSLADMKAAITQKMSWMVTPLARQSAAYIEEQLNLAGFEVKVYPNRFDDGMGGFVTKTPGQVFGGVFGQAVYGYPQYGTVQYGQLYTGDATITKCVNYLEEDKDWPFVIGPVSGMKSTFYISGDPITTPAVIPEARKVEYRQLILRLKTAQMCAILFTNYTS